MGGFEASGAPAMEMNRGALALESESQTDGDMKMLGDSAGKKS